MPHSIGHGWGLLSHNGIIINEKIDSILVKGEVVTVEPGWYVPSLCGIRLEHDILVNDGYAEVLTKKLDFKDLIEV